MLVQRYFNNPILSPEQILPSREDFEVVATLNPGVTRFNGKTLLFLRVAERPKAKSDNILRVPAICKGGNGIIEFDKSDKTIDFSDSRVVTKNGQKYLTSMSYFVPAVSDDGINFNIDYGGELRAKGEPEAFGIEDSRITRIGDRYYITYASASLQGVCTSLAVTDDFKTYENMGVILTSDNKDAALFPDKINGKYYMAHRPSYSEFGKPEIWVAESADLYGWGNHRHVMGLRVGMWDSCRIGSSSVPIITEKGWFMVYHGADENNRYCLGACLMAKDEPWKLIARSKTPFLEPVENYETSGFFGKVVFSCGCVEDGKNIKIYYGAADKYVCLATANIDEIINSMEFYNL